MQALYRKYRSKTLDELVGQEHITTTLASAIRSGRISHAYLFTGPKGVGKTSVARILAHEINQLPYTDDELHLDIIEIDAASNRRIDDIRDLRDKIHIAPSSARYKVYIIDEVHMLTGESFNALLKTLEEPPEHVVFILATTEVHKLPATIISRTQRYSFRPVEQQKVVAHLKHIAQQEKITIDESALELIAEHGEGSFRDSISLLDQLANVSGGSIGAEVVEQNLGLAPKSAIEALITGLKNKDYKTTVEHLQKLDGQGIPTASLVPQLIRALQPVALQQPQLYTLIDTLLEVPRAYNPSVKLLTALVAYCLKNEVKNLNKPQSIAQVVQPLLEVTRTHPKTHSVVQTEDFLSENSEARGEVAIATSTRAEGFAAKKDQFAARGGFGMGSKQAKPVKETPPATLPVTKTADSKPLTALPIDQWAAVLARIKVISPPLYGVFRQAEPQFNAGNQLLTLTFKYQLHRKRADETKAKNELTKAMLEVLGGAPTLVTVVNTQAQVPDFTTLKPPMDETAKSVAALMGGGEVVHG